MKKRLLFYVIFTCHGIAIFAESNYPVDISYMVTDFKYSQEDGLKICEVQHGSLSTVTGDEYVSGEEDGTISPKLADLLICFPLKKWTTGLNYLPVKRSLTATGWDVKQSLTVLINDPTFLKCATVPPVDRFSLASYAGIVYADCAIVKNFDYYRKAYLGILFMNAATLPYWRDKYKMNALFELNDELRQYKADWRLYQKKYDPFLAEQIQKELPSEFYVIKPRSEVLANGVIIVTSSDLDTVLKMILEPLESLKKHPDKKYAYWLKNKDDSFLIEKYYKSDYLRFPLPLSEELSCEGDYHYDATMRIAFVLHFNEGKMTYQSLGGFWKLPAKALEEEGTLNERKISCCKPPFYRPVDPELLKEVNLKMERAMLLLYEIMLHG